TPRAAAPARDRVSPRPSSRDQDILSSTERRYRLYCATSTSAANLSSRRIGPVWFVTDMRERVKGNAATTEEEQMTATTKAIGIGYFEIPVSNLARAKQFYEAVFQ